MMATEDLPRSTGALLRAARVFFSTAAADEWPKEEPQRLTTWANAFAVVPMLYAAARRAGIDEPLYRQAYFSTAAKTVRLVHELQAVTAALEREGLEAAAFKGVVLSQQLYGDPLSRQAVDIDLMIRRRDRRRVIETLAAEGYQPAAPIFHDERLLDRLYSVELVHHKNKSMLDVQWDIANGYCPAPFSEEELFRRTMTVEFEGRMVRTFDDTMTLYLLAVHGAKCMWCELRSLIDGAAAMRRFSAAAWREAYHLLERVGAESMLTAGALTAERLLGVEAPIALDDPDRRARRLAERTLDFWRQRHQPLQRPDAWSRFFWDLSARRGRERLRYFFFRLQPTKTDMHHRSTLLPKRLLRVIRRS